MKVLRNLSILLSVLLLLIVINPQVVYATSETFSLSPATPTVRNVELQKNDRLVGSFAITNIQTWNNGWANVQAYVCSVIVIDPNGLIVLSYARTEGDSFDYTAFNSGVYKIQFLVGIEYMPPSDMDIQNPKATLNYNVVSPSQSEPAISGNLPIWIILTFIAGIVIFAITIIAYLETRSRSKNQIE